MERKPGRPEKKLIAWVRWYLAADGPGPQHCGVCQRARKEQSWCGRCHNPPLLPEHEGAVALYLACETQWRYGGMAGVRTGLDYAGVQVLMNLRGDSRETFEGLRILERETLHIDAARASKG